MSSNTFQNYYGVDLNSNEGRWAVAQVLAQAPTEQQMREIGNDLGFSLLEVDGIDAWIQINLAEAVYANGLEAENQVAMGIYGVINVSLGVNRGDLLGALDSYYKQDQNVAGDLRWRDVATAELTIWGAAFTIAEHNSKPLYQGPKSWKAEAKLAGRTGIKLGLLGLGVTGIDLLMNGPTTSSTLDGIFGAVATFGGAPGAIVGGVYFAVNFGTTVMTGKSLGQHVDDNYIIVPGPIIGGAPMFIKR